MLAFLEGLFLFVMFCILIWCMLWFSQLLGGLVT